MKKTKGQAGKRRERAPQETAWRRHAPAVAGLWALALVVWANGLSGGLAADAASLLHDPRLADLGAWWRLWGEQYWASGTSGLYRPLATLSYLFNFSALGNGLNPSGYHAVNLALHAANAALAYALGWALFKKRGSAWAMAALWSVHPVLTESVTNIAGRPDLLAGLGVLGGLVAHLRAREAEGRTKRMWLAALGAASLVGLFSKESAVALVGLMALYDATWRPRRWREAAGGYAVAAVTMGVYFWARHSALAGAPPMHVMFTDNPLTGMDFVGSRLAALKVMAQYVGLLVWPARLVCDYSYNAIPLTDGRDAWTLAAAGLWASSAAAAAWCYARARAVWFWMAFFAATMGLTSNLAVRIGTIMAERFLYVPALAAAALAVIAGEAAARRVGVGRVAWAGALVCCALAWRTYARNADWADKRSLWESAVAAAPANAKARITLADIRLEGRDLAGATEQAERALETLEPLADERNAAASFAIAGRVFRARGEAAREEAERARWFERARAALDRGERVDRAVAEAMRRSGAARFYAQLGTTEVYQEMGLLYTDLRQPEKAAAAFERARRVRGGAPDPADTAGLAAAYYGQGAWRRAAVTLNEGRLLHPAAPRFLEALVGLYREKAPGGCAVDGAGRLDASCGIVREDQCAALVNVAKLYRERGATAAAASVERAAEAEACGTR